MASTAQMISNGSQDFTVLRGLEARIEWSLVSESAEPSLRYMVLGGIRLSAHSQGAADAWRGRTSDDLPPLFADVPDLADAWSAGWRMGDAMRLERAGAGVGERDAKRVEGVAAMETSAITPQQAVIDLNDIGARLEDLTALSVLTAEQAQEYQQLLSVVAQTTHMDGCDYFTPMLYRFDARLPKVEKIVGELEVTFYGVAYTAIATVAG